MIGLLQALFILLKAALDFWNEREKRLQSAQERVKATEEEKSKIAGLIVQKKSGALAQKARFHRLVLAELLRDPKLRQDLQRASTRGSVVPSGPQVPENGRAGEETISVPPSIGDQP